MIETGHRTRAFSPEGRPDLSLTYVETGVRGAARFGGFGISYLRPTLVTSAENGVRVRIRDHVMLARLAMVTLVVVATIWGWRR